VSSGAVGDSDEKRWRITCRSADGAGTIENTSGIAPFSGLLGFRVEPGDDERSIRLSGVPSAGFRRS
jgi:hypothetical protein